MALVTSSNQPCSVAGRIIKSGVVSVEAPEVITISLNGTSLANLGICTGIETKQTVSAQFQKTLGDDIYVVPFGDQPGDTSISFIANRTCDEINGGGAKVISYYLANRLRPARTGSIIIGIGGMSLVGFLTGLAISAKSDGTPLVTGVLFFKNWPT